MAIGIDFAALAATGFSLGDDVVVKIDLGDTTVFPSIGAEWTAFFETSRAGGISSGAVRTAFGNNFGGASGTPFTLSTGTPTTPVTTDSGPAVEGTPTGQARSGSVVTCGGWGPATGPTANILLDQTRSCTTTFDLGASTRVDTIPTGTTASTRTDVIRTPIAAVFRTDSFNTQVTAIIAQEDRTCELSGVTVDDAQCPVDGLPSDRAVTIANETNTPSTQTFTIAGATNSDANSTVTVSGPTTGSRQVTVTVAASSTGNTEAFTGTFTDGLGQSRTINNPAYEAPVSNSLTTSGSIQFDGDGNVTINTASYSISPSNLTPVASESVTWLLSVSASSGGVSGVARGGYSGSTRQTIITLTHPSDPSITAGVAATQTGSL